MLAQRVVDYYLSVELDILIVIYAKSLGVITLQPYLIQPLKVNFDIISNSK